jgi:hypothetical protein
MGLDAYRKYNKDTKNINPSTCISDAHKIGAYLRAG